MSIGRRDVPAGRPFNCGTPSGAAAGDHAMTTNEKLTDELKFELASAERHQAAGDLYETVLQMLARVRRSDPHAKRLGLKAARGTGSIDEVLHLLETLQRKAYDAERDARRSAKWLGEVASL